MNNYITSFIFVLLTVGQCRTVSHVKLDSHDISGEWKFIEKEFLEEKTPYIVEFLADGTIIDPTGQLCRKLTFFHVYPWHWKMHKYIEKKYACTLRWHRKGNLNLFFLSSFNKESEIIAVSENSSSGQLLKFVMILPGTIATGFRTDHATLIFRAQKLQ